MRVFRRHSDAHSKTVLLFYIYFRLLLRAELTCTFTAIVYVLCVLFLFVILPIISRYLVVSFIGPMLFCFYATLHFVMYFCSWHIPDSVLMAGCSVSIDQSVRGFIMYFISPCHLSYHRGGTKYHKLPKTFSTVIDTENLPQTFNHN